MVRMTATNDDAALARIATAVRHRRTELGLSKAAVAQAAGVSINTFQRLEQGERVRDINYVKIEGVLGWQTGSCHDMLKGADGPVLSERGPKFRVVESVGSNPAFEAKLDEEVAQAVTAAAVAATDSLTASDIRELSRRVVEELRRRGLLGS